MEGRSSATEQSGPSEPKGGLDPGTTDAWDGGRVWYAAYGSNLDAERFRCYLHGGCPPGATRTYPGAREPADPLGVRPFTMPGRLAFAWRSPTWGGGIAFHEPDAEGTTLARAYLVTPRQFADVVEQEMRREPGADHDLAGVLGTGRHTLGPGRYETLTLVGELEGVPVLSFSTTDVASLGVRPPVAAYVRTMARGLHQAHGLDVAQIVAYLEPCPGVDGAWSHQDLTDVVRDALPA